MHRLQRLARIYGVDPDLLLRPERPDEIDLVRLEQIGPVGLLLDLSRFRKSADARSAAIMDFAAAIKAMRNENGASVLVVRRSDTALVSALLDCDPADVDRALMATLDTANNSRADVR